MNANPRFDQAYAILRYETEAAASVPIEVRITVKKIVLDPHCADHEVKRLNELNQGKGCYYFFQATRLEKGVLGSLSAAGVVNGAEGGEKVSP